jgi:hypothetical protein
MIIAAACMQSAMAMAMEELEPRPMTMTMAASGQQRSDIVSREGQKTEDVMCRRRRTPRHTKFSARSAP